MKIKTVAYAGLCAFSLMAAPVMAGGLFSAAILVNDGVITNYELQQRERFLSLLKFPGNPRDLAREQLVDERLKQAAAKQLGISVDIVALERAMEQFSARANLTTDEFIAELEKAGVDRATFSDFMAGNVLWGDVIRTKFGAKARVSDEELQRAVKTDTSGTGIEVSLTEIIMAADPGFEAEVMAKAEELATIKSISKFSQAARDYSDAPTRDVGGLIAWQKLDQLPPVLQPLIFGLATGQVTPPLALPNAVALFQLRDIRETAYNAPVAGAIDYAQYRLPASEAENLARLRADIVHCDDLYAWAKGNPNHVLTRDSKKPDEIATPTRDILKGLDDNEFVVRKNGQDAEITMLCGRTPATQDTETNLEELRNSLRNKRLETFAQGYLDNLRNDARIVTK